MSRGLLEPLAEPWHRELAYHGWMRERRAAVGGLALAGSCLLGTGVLGVGLGGCAGPGATSAHRTSVVSSGQAAARPDLPSAGTGTVGSNAQRSREMAVQSLLDERAAAVGAHDRGRFAATLDDPASSFGRRQLIAFGNLVQLPLGVFRYGTVQSAAALRPERAAAVGPGAWLAKVDGEYSLSGYDRAPTTYQTYFTLVHRSHGWRLADDRDGGTQAELWDLPGMHVTRSPSTLVVGDAPDATLTAYRKLGEAAVRQVSADWHRPWPGRLVLVAPHTTAEMAAQLQQQDVDVAQVAAVTDGPIPPGGTATADRVVINPAAFERLQPRGRAAVVTHESTHVAIRASTPGTVPLWLSEGMADYVGYGAVRLSRQEIAKAVLDQVRAGKGPRTLPADGAFDPSHTTIAPAYNAAWLAVSRIADLHGEASLTPFYATAAKAGTEQAFRSVLATTEADFTRSWLTYLDALAGRVG